MKISIEIEVKGDFSRVTTGNQGSRWDLWREVFSRALNPGQYEADCKRAAELLRAYALGLESQAQRPSGPLERPQEDA